MNAQKDSLRLFWLIQALGWLGYAVMRASISLSLSEKANFTTMPLCSLSSAVIGFGVSTLLFIAYWRMRAYPISLVIGLSILSVLLAASLFALADVALTRLITGSKCCGATTIRLTLLQLPEKIYLLSAWSGIYFGVRFYRQAVNEKTLALQASAAADKAELQMLRYQLNPHLLFNALNTISGLIVKNKPGEADRMVQNLGQYFRHMLSSPDDKLIPLVEEIDSVKRYLLIEQTRFENRLSVDIQVSEEAGRAMVPAFILQPLIENTIKHGINVQEGKYHIGIHARVQGKNLKISLNTASEFPFKLRKKEVKGIGHENVLSRLRLHFGDNAGFHAAATGDREYRVNIEIPFQQGGTPE